MEYMPLFYFTAYSSALIPNDLLLHSDENGLVMALYIVK
jgi:hypothetical protein